jgi:hypothetical protein
VSGQLHAPTALLPVEKHPVDREPGGPQSGSARSGRNKYLGSVGNRTATIQLQTVFIPTIMKVHCRQAQNINLRKRIKIKRKK